MNLYIVNYAPPPHPSISLSLYSLSIVSFFYLSFYAYFILCNLFFSNIHIYHYFPEEAEMYSCTLYVNQHEI